MKGNTKTVYYEILLDNEVIVSNYSKAVDGKLVLDDTNKVTKKAAIDTGSYVKPDFTVYLK